MSICPVTEDDLELLLAWRMLNPETAAKGNRTPAWQEHVDWFRGGAGKRLDFVICNDQRRVGFVSIRLDVPAISIHLAEPGLRRKGIASESCLLAMEQLKAKGGDHCYAEIHRENLASQRFFQNLGFELKSGTEDVWQSWRKELKATDKDEEVESMANVPLTEESASQVGLEMHDLMTDLFPICRSITGDGVRQSHDLIRKIIPITTHEIPTGTEVLDWTIPKEWNIESAYVIAPDGRKTMDFEVSNLHVLNYSSPVKAKISLDELKSHLHSSPDNPDVIPYFTSYYAENWGFCLRHNELLELEDGEYEVFIDSSLENGNLTYSEFLIPGEIEDEVLISCYTCHPSLCNDNLSGVVLSTFLARHLSKKPNRYSYRFLFIPETIGAIAWLSINDAEVGKVKHGLVATCVGDPGRSTYKKSRRGDAEIDRAVTNVLKHSGADYEIIEFFPSGSDERQFCSPGYDLPMGSLMRTPYARYPEYHNSSDDLDFVRPEYLADSYEKYLSVFNILENNRIYVNSNPKGEPQLGKRGLYRAIAKPALGQRPEASDEIILWVLNLSDGSHSLLDIAETSGEDFVAVQHAADILHESGLLDLAESIGQD